MWHQGAAIDNLMAFTMEKVEKRLTDLSGALAHNYPEIKLRDVRRRRELWKKRRAPDGKSGNKISFL
jgi:hypothetical protein